MAAWVRRPEKEWVAREPRSVGLLGRPLLGSRSEPRQVMQTPKPNRQTEGEGTR